MSFWRIPAPPEAQDRSCDGSPGWCGLDKGFFVGTREDNEPPREYVGKRHYHAQDGTIRLLADGEKAPGDACDDTCGLPAHGLDLPPQPRHFSRESNVFALLPKDRLKPDPPVQSAEDKPPTPRTVGEANAHTGPQLYEGLTRPPTGGLTPGTHGAADGEAFRRFIWQSVVKAFGLTPEELAASDPNYQDLAEALEAEETNLERLRRAYADHLNRDLREAGIKDWRIAIILENADSGNVTAEPKELGA